MEPTYSHSFSPTAMLTIGALAHVAGPTVPVYLGAATHRILKAAAPFVPRPYVPALAVEYESGVPLSIGPFRITPHLVDHSAYDAYAIEVEAGGTAAVLLRRLPGPRTQGRHLRADDREPSQRTSTSC